MDDSSTAISPPVPGPDLNQDPARLKRKRVEAGLGLREAAELAGISPSQLSKFENAKGNARPRRLASLAKVYDCEIPDLMPVAA